MKIENMTAEIISLKEKTNYYYRYEIKVNNFDLKFSRNTKNLLYTKNEELFPGDIVIINGEFEKAKKATNYKEFDYRNYLKQSKIYGIIYEKNIKVIRNKKDLYYFFGNIRSYLLKQIELNYGEETYGFMQGILLGFSNNLSKDMLEDFRGASILHVLAISGMHVSIVIIFSNYLLKNFIKNRKFRNFILIMFLIFFYIITGMNNSCFRAVIMTILQLLAFNSNRKNSFIRSLIFSFFIIISINIYNIFSVGLWLSFMGVLGIYFFSNSFIKIFNHFYKGGKSVLKLLAPCVSSQILIFPIAIYLFNMFSITFLVSNIVTTFLIDKVLILGYISILLNSKFISYLNSFLISIIFKTSQICSMGKVYFKTPNIIFLIMYYAIIIYLRKNTFKFWKNILNKKKRKKVYKICIVIITIVSLISFTFNQLNELLNTKLKIYFVDIGQGDCTVLKTPKGKIIIIDGGEENEILFPYLLDRGIEKIDYLIVSHFDSDHVEGLFSIMKNMKVEKAIIGKQFCDSQNYKTFLQIAKINRIEVLTVEAETNIYIEKNLKIEVLWPSSENIITENVLNNNSLVFKLIYKDFSMLFTGDIEETGEKKILEKYNDLLKSDILKVAHHGSKTSSIKEFLMKVNPEIAVIGVGRKNKFGHPNQIILDSLDSLRLSNL